MARDSFDIFSSEPRGRFGDGDRAPVRGNSRSDLVDLAMVLLAAIEPHPDCGRPRLWTLGVKDHAIKTLMWPLPQANEIPSEPVATVEIADNVVHLGGRT